MGSRLGILKLSAKRLGISFDDYIRKTELGLKWCYLCRLWLPHTRFGIDRRRRDKTAARCRDCQREFNRAAYSPKRVERRCNDKLQARARINADVRMGLRPDPNNLHCAACGHKGYDRRHEYHHHLGYAPEHHYDVLSLCSSCHHEEHANGRNVN